MKSRNNEIWQLSGFGKSRETEEPKMSQVSDVGDQNDSNFLQEEIWSYPTYRTVFGIGIRMNGLKNS